MDYVELAKNVLLSEGAFGIYATILGIILAYVFNNYINKPVSYTHLTLPTILLV